MNPLEAYNSQAEKEQVLNEYGQINNFSQLIEAFEWFSNKHFIYRGLNNASFKMYSSAQRHWLTKDRYFNYIGGNDFDDFILRILKKAKSDEIFIKFFTSRSISINDILILSVLQHYLCLSPLIDFTFNFHTALFFATDGCKNYSAQNRLSDYFSIYYIDSNIDWMQSSIQKINSSGLNTIESQLNQLDNSLRERIDITNVLQEIADLDYSKIKDWGFLPVDGPDVGTYSLLSEELNFTCDYTVSNPRINQQRGMFILNPSDITPLIEQINSTTGQYQRIVNCIDVHCSLIPEIQKNILAKNFISKDSVYPNSKESKTLETIVKRNFEPHIYKRILWKIKSFLTI